MVMRVWGRVILALGILDAGKFREKTAWSGNAPAPTDRTTGRSDIVRDWATWMQRALPPLGIVYLAKKFPGAATLRCFIERKAGGAQEIWCSAGQFQPVRTGQKH